MAKQSSSKFISTEKFKELYEIVYDLKTQIVADLKTQVINTRKDHLELIGCFKNMIQEFSSVKSDFVNLKGHLAEQKSDTEMLKKKLYSLKSELDRCINQVIGCELQISKQAESIIKQKLIRTKQNSNVDRKNNIIVKGLPINNKDDRKHFFSKFFTEAMQIQVEILKVIQIPIMSKGSIVPAYLVVLKSQTEKRKIFGNCHKLKNYPFKISNCDDLDKEDRELRKKAVEEFIKVKKLRKNSMKQYNTVVKTDHAKSGERMQIEAVQFKQVKTSLKAQESIAKEIPELVKLQPVCLADCNLDS